MKNYEELYWESYDDQNSEDFQYVGVAGEVPVPIDNLDVQVREIYRTRGHNVEIRVYREEESECSESET